MPSILCKRTVDKNFVSRGIRNVIRAPSALVLLEASSSTIDTIYSVKGYDLIFFIRSRTTLFSRLDEFHPFGERKNRCVPSNSEIERVQLVSNSSLIPDVFIRRVTMLSFDSRQLYQNPSASQ